MRLFRIFPLVISAMFVLALSSCKEDDPIPEYEAKARLLAGEKGASKSWKLVSATVTYNGDTDQFEFEACFLDNIYKFTNNATQDYEATEGLSKCVSEADAVIESGNWSFTADGGMLIVLANDYTDSDAVLFSYFTVPATVTELTENSMKLEIELDYDGEVETYNLVFAAN